MTNKLRNILPFILILCLNGAVLADGEDKKSPLLDRIEMLEKRLEIMDKKISTVESSQESLQQIIFQSTKDQSNSSVKKLKETIKCSLANFWDIQRTAEEAEAEKLPKLLYAENGSLAITWFFPSNECERLTTGLWIRISEQYRSTEQDVKPFMYIPKKCFITGASIGTVLIHSGKEEKDELKCKFSILELIRCHAYTVEFAVDYDSLPGALQHSDIIIPPKLDKDEILGPLVMATANSTSMKLNWVDRSGCASQLTSISLRIYEDRNITSLPISSYLIPSHCLEQIMENLFSASLSSNDPCPSEGWQPLDQCRTYTLEMEPEYWNTWKGSSAIVDIFTVQRDKYAGYTGISTTSLRQRQHCPPNSIFCTPHYQSYRGKVCTPIQVCDNKYDCYDQRDENQCAEKNCYGFRCGRQCVPYDKICDGYEDCIDGTDESVCEETKLLWCEHVTSSSGTFASADINPDTNLNRNTLFSISAKPNYNIWFTIDRLCSSKTIRVKVYDGPNRESSTLLSHIDCNKTGHTGSVRSNSNHMVVVFPPNTYVVKPTSHYISVESDGTPFIPGCGGYIVNVGIMRAPRDNPRNHTSSDLKCVWYLETGVAENTLMLYNFNREDSSYSMTVYDGWSESDPIIYRSSRNSDKMDKIDKMEPNFFSLGNRLRVEFISHNFSSSPIPRTFHILKPEPGYFWDVSTISSVNCQTLLTESRGTIKSPQYPSSYPPSSDCRWTVQVDAGLKIRLSFGVFETQAEHDILYVYDGPSTNSSVILKKSGKITSPLILQSSSNQIVVRFTSDGYGVGHGFLAVYSSVS